MIAARRDARVGAAPRKDDWPDGTANGRLLYLVIREASEPMDAEDTGSPRPSTLAKLVPFAFDLRQTWQTPCFAARTLLPVRSWVQWTQPTSTSLRKECATQVK